jgi:hypothetical protein
MRVWLLIFLIMTVSCGKKNDDEDKDAAASGSGTSSSQTTPGPQGTAGPQGPAGTPGEPGRDANYVPSSISARSPTGNMTAANAATYCRDLVESGFDDWHIPTIEELAPFFGIDNDTNYVWTRTPSASTSIYFILARVDTGYIMADSNPPGKYARCVR